MYHNVIGTAYAIRGICYYQLLRCFCDAPNPNNLESQLGVALVTEFDMEEKAIRSNMKKTIELIISDLETAITFNVQDKVYRFNNDVITGYLARLYFWCGDYNKAIYYSEQLLDKYPLIEGEEYKGMIESRIQVKGNVIFKSELLRDAEKDNVYSGNFNYLQARPASKRFLDTFKEKEADIRYNLWFNKKRKNIKPFTCSMRSAEFCLILAESYYHENNKEKSLYYLNLLRSNRIENVKAYTESSLPEVVKDMITVDAKGNELTPLIYSILTERRKELYGDRWFELKRNGKPEFWVAKQGLKYFTKSYMYTFPIPNPDIQLVSGLIQNPGYTDFE